MLLSHYIIVSVNMMCGSAHVHHVQSMRKKKKKLKPGALPSSLVSSPPPTKTMESGIKNGAEPCSMMQLGHSCTGLVGVKDNASG
jgi:hypothetical protein